MRPAKKEILLASPYWDLEVAEDLAPLLERRLAAGVTVRILARSPSIGSQSESALRVLARHSGEEQAIEIRTLEERSSLDPFGAATFHFKVAVADAARVYVGSANFNTAGMASRWELGVVLKGRQAAGISDLMSALFARAARMQPA